MSKHAVLLGICGLMSACTIVQVQGGSPSTSVHFGILKIEPAPGARSLSLRIRGAGIVPGISGATLGFSRQDAVIAYHAEDCRVVIFDPPPGGQSGLPNINDPAICTMGGGNEH